MVNLTVNPLVVDMFHRQPGPLPFYIIMYIALFAFSSIVGTIGNSLIILTLLFDNKLRCSQNMFVCSLALADFIVASVTMPSSIVGALFGGSWFDEHYLACSLIASLCAPSCLASLFSMAWISVSRFFYITRIATYRKYFAPTRVALYVASIWATAALLHIPNHVGWGSVHFSILLDVCTIDTETLSYRLFFATLTIVSLGTTFFFYGKIYLALRNTTLARNMIVNNGDKRDTSFSSMVYPSYVAAFPFTAKKVSTLEEETKMIKATFKIFLSFLLCWTPISIVFVINLGDRLPLWVYLYVGLLAHGNSTTNFFMYFVLNDTFMKALIRIVMKCRKWGRPISEVSPTGNNQQ